MQSPHRRLPGTHHRMNDRGLDPAGAAVGKGRLPIGLGLGAAVMIFALALFAAAAPAFAQEESTMMGATTMRLTDGSPDLSSQGSTMAPSDTTRMTTTAAPPSQTTRPSASYPSTGMTTTMTTTSQPAATVPSGTTMPTAAQGQYPAAAQGQYSDPPQQTTLANTGGISPIAIVVGVIVVLAAFGVWLHFRRESEAGDE